MNCQIFRILFLLLSAVPINAALPVRVQIPAGDIKLTGEYLAPVKENMPAVLVMHGCGGLYAKSGEIGGRMARMGSLLQEMGYGVLFLDSFTPRGIRQVCTSRSNADWMTPKLRADDAEGAIRWLRVQRNVDVNRIGIMGWSHGADAVLELMGRNVFAVKAAVTYYPDCQLLLDAKSYRVSAPTLVLIGGSDEWTSSHHCKNLAAKSRQDLLYVVVYPGILHDFDAQYLAPYAKTDIANRLTTSAGVALSGADVEAGYDANRRTFKWFSRWFDPERAINGVPPANPPPR